MLIQSNAPKAMWSEAALTAVYLINRCPTRCLDNFKTPVEMWLVVKPTFEKIKVFGCKAYAWIPHQYRKKLDARSKKSVMVGYAPNGYRLWDMEKQKVIIARDVKFEENMFPFMQLNNVILNDVVTVSRRHEQEGENECDGAVSITETRYDENQVGVDRTDIRKEVDELNTDNRDKVNNTAVDFTEDDETLSDAAVPVRRSNRERYGPRKLLNYITGFEVSVTNKTIS